MKIKLEKQGLERKKGRYEDDFEGDDVNLVDIPSSDISATELKILNSDPVRHLDEKDRKVTNKGLEIDHQNLLYIYSFIQSLFHGTK